MSSGLPELTLQDFDRKLIRSELSPRFITGLGATTTFRHSMGPDGCRLPGFCNAFASSSEEGSIVQQPSSLCTFVVEMGHTKRRSTDHTHFTPGTTPASLNPTPCASGSVQFASSSRFAPVFRSRRRRRRRRRLQSSLYECQHTEVRVVDV